MAVRSYRELGVWQSSMDWVEQVYHHSRSFPADERFGLTSQVRRAAVSVAANIAEGAARRSTGEFLQFIGIAKGSLAEGETLLILAKRLKLIEGASADVLLHDADRVGRMLSGLSRSLEAN
jgi:four helix bundle protein